MFTDAYWPRPSVNDLPKCDIRSRGWGLDPAGFCTGLKLRGIGVFSHTHLRAKANRWGFELLPEQCNEFLSPREFPLCGHIQLNQLLSLKIWPNGFFKPFISDLSWKCCLLDKQTKDLLKYYLMKGKFFRRNFIEDIAQPTFFFYDWFYRGLQFNCASVNVYFSDSRERQQL